MQIAVIGANGQTGQDAVLACCAAPDRTAEIRRLDFEMTRDKE